MTATTSALARRFRVDVSSDGTNWVPFNGLNDLNPSINPTLQSTDDYNSNGFSGSEKTMQGWSLTLKALRKTTAAVFDAGQELVRACRLAFGDQARVYVRWYDKNGAPEAYSGRALVEWNASKTGVADVDEVQVKLTGDGVLTDLSQATPYVPASAPTVIAATPSGAATGALVQITGAYFTGTTATTGVKFGGVNATNWVVISDGLIVATVPTGTAGSAPITVTNATGTSNSFAYTRAA